MKLRHILRKAKSLTQRVLHSGGKDSQKPSSQPPSPASPVDHPPLGQTSPPLDASKTLNENVEPQSTNVSKLSSERSQVACQEPNVSLDGQQCLEHKNGSNLGYDPEDSASSQGHTLSSIFSLWDEAYDQLSTDEKTAELFESYGKILVKAGETEGIDPINHQPVDGSSKRQKHMDVVIMKKTKEIEDGDWKLHFKGRELAVKDFVQSVASIVEWGKGLVDKAVQASPPAALAWAGVCLLLPLLLAPGHQDASRVEGLEKIAGIIRESFFRETVYHSRYGSTTGTEIQAKSIRIHNEYRESIKSLYSAILSFQATYVCFLCENNTGQRWMQDVVGKHDWGDMIKRISRKNEELRSQDQKWQDHAQQEEWEALTKRHKEALAKTDSLLQEGERIRKLIMETKIQNHRVDLLGWLQPQTTPSQYHNSAVMKRKRHLTGRWFLERKVFTDWSKRANSFLWLIGKAGAGKSVLSSTIIEHLESSRGNDPYTAVAYYYVTSSDKETFSIDNLTRSLITQLFGRRPETPEILLRLGEYRHTSVGPPQSKLEEVLRSAFNDFTRAYVVIDGLDECPVSENKGSGYTERRILLELLETLQNWGLANLHFLVTSRREQDIEDAFQRVLQTPQGDVIDLANSADSLYVKDDIGLFINEELKRPKFNSLTTDFKAQIRKDLMDKSDGVFHYASLQIDRFHPPVTPDLVEEILEGLPSDLNETYERALYRLEPEQKQAACYALTWLAFSLVPLTVTELAAAVPIGLPTDENQDTDMSEKVYLIPPFKPGSRITDPKQVLHLLPGLHSLQTREPAEEGWAAPVAKDNMKPDETVVLTHFTLLEYLISDSIKKQETRQFALSRTAANLQLADACLRYHVYISNEGHDIIQEQLQAEYPLWRYVARHGLQHAEIVGRQAWPKSLRHLILYIFRDEENSLAKLKLHSGYTLRNGHDLPIQYAIDQRLLETFEFLFEEGLADVGLGPSGRDRLLVQAVENMDAEVALRLLKKHAASANAKSEEGEPAILVAYKKKDISMVELLLACGADINATNRLGETMLFEAAFLHDEEMAAKLAKDGAGLLATRSGENGFHWAAYHDSPRLADILWSAGGSESRISEKSRRQDTPLHWAAEYGNRVMLQWLLTHGAEVNARMDDGGTALHLAATKDDQDAMTLLLDHEADVNAVNGAGETALFLFIKETELIHD